MVKADLAASVITDFDIRSGESSGYGITADMNEEDLNTWLIKWSPYITFEAYPVVNADQQIAALQTPCSDDEEASWLAIQIPLFSYFFRLTRIFT